MNGEIFSDWRIGRRVEELAINILEKESMVIHRLVNNEAQQHNFYRLLHDSKLETGQVVVFIRHYGNLIRINVQEA